MSLYNMLFGVNGAAPLLLRIINVDPSAIPRFRDVYVEDGNIVIYTRTGGGNRDYYENEETCRDNYPEYFDGETDPSGPWNDDLRAVPSYVRDQDDDFDSTYANFYYSVPAEFADAVKKIEDGTETPVEYWENLLKKLAES